MEVVIFVGMKENEKTPLDKLREKLAEAEKLLTDAEMHELATAQYHLGYVHAMRQAVAILEADAVEKSSLFQNQKSEK